MGGIFYGRYKLKCTKEIAQKALLMGACTRPEIGKPVQDFSQKELVWAERLNIKSKYQLWSLSQIGKGREHVDDYYDHGYGEGRYGVVFSCGCGIKAGNGPRYGDCKGCGTTCGYNHGSGEVYGYGFFGGMR